MSENMNTQTVKIELAPKTIPFGFLTIIPERVVHEGAIIVGVEPEQRKWQACLSGRDRLNDQRLFSCGQRNALSPT